MDQLATSPTWRNFSIASRASNYSHGARTATAVTIIRRSSLLPDELHAKFEAAIAAGKTPKVVYARHIGWHVRSFENNGSPKAANSSQAETTEQKAEPEKTAAAFTLRPFVPFDPAALPPRQWLYGRHYQRRTVSGTVSPGA